MNISLIELANRLGGKLSDLSLSEKMTTAFVLDSRDAKPSSVFIAIRGSKVDGNDFADVAIRNGCLAVISERVSQYPHILVTNIVESLANMASSFRREFEGPVIGVTGSTGKTTTKEMIAHCLEGLGPGLKTEGNRNTEYTVPLIWADSKNGSQFAVIEMSMRGRRQIRHLSSFCSPTVGIITNIGYSHLEVLGSRDEIFRSKSELFESLPENGLAIYWKEDDFAVELSQVPKCPVATFGFNDGSDCQIVSYEQFGLRAIKIIGLCDGSEWTIESNLVGKHIALAMASSLLISKRLGLDLNDTSKRLSSFNSLQMRMEIVNCNGATIIKDFYNASPDSMSVALSTLSDSKPKGRKLAILAAMRELGDYEQEAHCKLGAQLAHLGFTEVVCLGDPMKSTVEAAKKNGMENIRMVDSVVEAKKLIESLGYGDALLVKGSRYYQLEDLF